MVGRTQGGGCGRVIISERGQGLVRSGLHGQEVVVIPILKGKIEVKGECCSASSTEGSLRHGCSAAPFVSGLPVPFIMPPPSQYC